MFFYFFGTFNPKMRFLKPFEFFGLKDAVFLFLISFVFLAVSNPQRCNVHFTSRNGALQFALNILGFYHSAWLCCLSWFVHSGRSVQIQTWFDYEVRVLTFLRTTKKPLKLNFFQNKHNLALSGPSLMSDGTVRSLQRCLPDLCHPTKQTKRRWLL